MHWNRRAGTIFGLCAVLATLGALLPQTVSGPLLICWALGCSLAVLRASRRLSGAPQRLYRNLALVAGAISLGILVRGIDGLRTGRDQPIPSLADLIHLPTYLLCAWTILSVHRARAGRSSRAAWLDSIGITLALVTVLWVWFVGAFVLDETLPLVERLLNVTYNGIILVSLAVVLRITATPGERPVSYYVLGTAYGAFFFVDIAGTFTYATSEGVSASVVLSPFVFGLMVLAAWHPSAGRLLDTHTEAELTIGRLRLTVIAVAMCTPLIALTHRPSINAPISNGVLALLCGGVIVSVMMRVLLLLQSEAGRATMEQRSSSEIAQLGTLNSVEEIRRAMPSAIARAVEVPCRLVADASDSPSSIDLIAPIRTEPVNSLMFERPLNPGQQRVATSMVTNAAFFALSVADNAAAAQRRLEEAAQQQVAASEKRFRSLVQNASDIFIVLDSDGKTTYASDAIARVLGYEPEMLLGKQLNTIVHENDQEPAARHFLAVLNGTKAQEKHEFRAYTADGEVRLFEAIMTDMTDVPEVNGIVVNGTDVTAERSLERDLKDAETIDPLTLQLNRKAFIQEIDTALRRASISGAAVSIAIIDLDDFKTINDALGPVLADQALVETANRIRRSVRLGDVVARLSGDEFGVLMPDGYSSLESVAAIERVLTELQIPFELDRHPMSLKATAGLSIDVGGSDTASVLLREADTALGMAKKSAPGKSVMFEEEMGSAVSERLDLRTGFERALQNDEMRLVYQPILDIATGRIVSLEALARWKHPERGEVSPSIFIPIAEDSNTITPLGEWALRSACRQVNEWTLRGLSDFTVSVNMSGQTLIEDDVITRVRSILRETKVDPARIIIEITETVLIDDTEFIADRISALRALGVALAIDDFGTGYSSLSYLQRYEFDYLKIDRAFVRPLAAPENVKDREIVAAIIRLAKGLGATTIAEGIEGESEHLVLQTLNCDRAQGFLFHRPKEVNEIFEILCEDLALDIAA